MLSIKNLIPILLLNLLSLGFTFADEDIPKVLLRYNIQSLNAGGQSYLSLNFQNEPKWHTYWKNPGDAGFGPKISFIDTENNLVDISPLEWPSPNKYIEPGDIQAYGYEGDYTFFYLLPKNFNKTFTAKLTWLICKHICIPGNGETSLEIERSIVTNSQTSPSDITLSPVSLDVLENRLTQIPITMGSGQTEVDIVLSEEKNLKNTLSLYYNVGKFNDTSIFKNRNLLFPFPHPYLEFKHEKLFSDSNGSIYAKMLIEWNGMYEEPEVPFPMNGILPKKIDLKFNYYSPKTNKNYTIEKSFSNLYQGKNLDAFLAILKPLEIKGSDNDPKSSRSKSVTRNGKSSSILRIILLAFIGGLILNFMPCVLPVISLKIFGLINQNQQTTKEIKKHNLLYTLGVLATFFVLALVIIILQKSGQAIGWGFQMQSPTFIASISIFLFLFSLNMFGLYEFVTPGGSKLGSIKLEGAKGDFLNGVLATILATPCSAPFLGTALAFAFTSGPLTILAIFLMVGLGLAFPFIMTGLFPASVKLLPKPGKWMNHFKKLMGISLLATVFWLISIFVKLNTDRFSLFILITLFTLGPVAIIIYQKVVKNIIIFLLAFFITVGGIYQIKLNQDTTHSTEYLEPSEHVEKYQMKWERWNPDIINEKQGKKLQTFVDFTADWCLTCKVNEKLVINTDSFRSFVEDKNIGLIMADWTDGNPVMTKWLQRNGMAGVPAYFYIDKEGNLHNLGETISISKIEELIR